MFCFFPLLHPKSTLGYVALLISTFHVLIYGWKRAFEGEYYRFYTPPNFVLALVLPSVVILGKSILLLPCISQKLKRIKKGWEKSQFPEEGVGGAVPHFSPERVTVMWWQGVLADAVRVPTHAIICVTSCVLSRQCAVQLLWAEACSMWSQPNSGRIFVRFMFTNVICCQYRFL